MSRSKFIAIDSQVNKDLRKTNVRLNKSYQDKLDEMRVYIRSLYDKYGGGTALPYDKFGNNLKNAQQVTNEIASGMYADLFKDVSTDLKAVYAYSFDETKNILSTISGAELRNTLQLDALDKALKAPVGGLTIDLRFDRYQADVESRMLQSLIQSSSQGKDFRGAVDDMKNVFGTDNKRMNRIIETESHRMMEQAKFDEAKAAAEVDGVESFKTWITMGDENVREGHADQNGMTIPLDEVFPDGSTVPGDNPDPALSVNCRCILEYTTEKK